MLAGAALLLGTGRAAAQERGQALTGAGSTFVQPVLNRWARAFATMEGEGGATVSSYGTLNYEPVGSAGGVIRMLQGSVDFAATDVPMAPEELARHELAQFPLVSGGIAVAANLDLPAGIALRLSGDVLARIYLGQITRWSDPAIRALQPDLALPGAPIVVLHRSDGSGTTWNVASFLARRSAAWQSGLGTGWTLPWPVGTGARGTRGIAEALRATPNAIAYLEVSEARHPGITVAQIDNAAGRFVAPDAAAIAAGVAGLPWDASRSFHQPAAEPASDAAYPILATVYVLMRRNPASMAGTRAALAFFRMALTERPAEAEALGFVPLAPAVAAQVTSYWPTAIRGAR